MLNTSVCVQIVRTTVLPELWLYVKRFSTRVIDQESIRTHYFLSSALVNILCETVLSGTISGESGVVHDNEVRF
ncbi:hypothetical protein HanRHA438_Chr01g0030871 [Helianthus annuus]|nr:hypothetical protein HanHA89_Chr01g0026701 [Helianthus annuus]KAJ0783823.1 hypothetical protein HanLR1_Chr01g0025291 [Helianthus annuus]KAJ0948723.1 hypothetical protein HanRHA438_Chr01g0030871 [Helianthus annuus]